MTQGIFVGWHDRTKAVLCVAKNEVVRGKNELERDTERCMGRYELGWLVWQAVAHGGS